MNSESGYRQQARWAYGQGQAIGEILRAGTAGSAYKGGKTRRGRNRNFPRMEPGEEW